VAVVFWECIRERENDRRFCNKKLMNWCLDKESTVIKARQKISTKEKNENIDTLFSSLTYMVMWKTNQIWLSVLYTIRIHPIHTTFPAKMCKKLHLSSLHYFNPFRHHRAYTFANNHCQAMSYLVTQRLQTLGPLQDLR